MFKTPVKLLYLTKEKKVVRFCYLFEKWKEDLLKDSHPPQPLKFLFLLLISAQKSHNFVISSIWSMPQEVKTIVLAVISLCPDNDDDHSHVLVWGVVEDRTVVRHCKTRAGFPIRSSPPQTFLLVFIFTL